MSKNKKSSGATVIFVFSIITTYSQCFYREGQKATYAACKPLFCNRSEISSHVQATNRISSYLRSLDDIQVDVTLVLIPGHCDDIHYNDLVDRRAKDSVKVAIEIPS